LQTSQADLDERLRLILNEQTEAQEKWHNEKADFELQKLRLTDEIARLRVLDQNVRTCFISNLP
jgi:hypothetical protein